MLHLNLTNVTKKHLIRFDDNKSYNSKIVPNFIIKKLLKLLNYQKIILVFDLDFLVC